MSALVTMFVDDKERAERALKVFKLVLGVGLSSGGLTAIALRLHEIGLLQ